MENVGSFDCEQMYTFEVADVSLTEPWIFIECKETDATMDIDPFIYLVKKAAQKMNNGKWAGNILPAGLYPEDTRYTVKNLPDLVFQYDTLFGIVIEYGAPWNPSRATWYTLRCIQETLDIPIASKRAAIGSMRKQIMDWLMYAKYEYAYFSLPTRLSEKVKADLKKRYHFPSFSDISFVLDLIKKEMRIEFWTCINPLGAYDRQGFPFSYSEFYEINQVTERMIEPKFLETKADWDSIFSKEIEKGISIRLAMDAEKEKPLENC